MYVSLCAKNQVLLCFLRLIAESLLPENIVAASVNTKARQKRLVIWEGDLGRRVLQMEVTTRKGQFVFCLLCSHFVCQSCKPHCQAASGLRSWFNRMLWKVPLDADLISRGVSMFSFSFTEFIVVVIEDLSPELWNWLLFLTPFYFPLSLASVSISRWRLKRWVGGHIILTNL